MATRIIEKVGRTGLKPSSKRAKLTTEIGMLSKQLERELKRDVTLKASAAAKKTIYDEMYSGGIPEWMLDVIFHAITEDSHKLNKKKVN